MTAWDEQTMYKFQSLDTPGEEQGGGRTANYLECRERQYFMNIKAKTWLLLAEKKADYLTIGSKWKPNS